MKASKDQMPVIILGMHRSGTSMITRLLHSCGLYLGEPEELMLPDSADNPEGYWEHNAISKLNDEILSHFGGSWRAPPVLEPGWSKDEALQLFWHHFEGITTHFRSHRYWGWKDPRNSLTLEFWLAHLPGLKVLLCLRNPIEVADSLSTGKPMRDMDQSEALRLWTEYHRAILQQDILDRIVVTHYESYLYDPDEELRRVLRALNIQASASQIEDALGTVKPHLKHQRIPEGFISDEPGLDDIRGYYESLCLRAGDVFEKLRSDTRYLLSSTVAYARTLRDSIAQLNENIDRQNREFADCSQLIEQQRQSLAVQRGKVAESEAHVADVQKKLAQLSSVVLDGFRFRQLKLSKIVAAAEKLRNNLTVKRLTRAIYEGQQKVPELFDSQWYLGQYPDVQDAGMHPYVHFCLFGWYQGYQPMPLFDTRWYVTNYPQFNADGANPLEHYERTGQHNGCRPCEGFDPQWYLTQYSDVRNAGIDPLYHYYYSGSREGRLPSQESSSLQYSNYKQDQL